MASSSCSSLTIFELPSSNKKGLQYEGGTIFKYSVANFFSIGLATSPKTSCTSTILSPSVTLQSNPSKGLPIQTAEGYVSVKYEQNTFGEKSSEQFSPEAIISFK